MKCLQLKRQWYDKNEKYHAHNQYLQILLDIDLIGFHGQTIFHSANEGISRQLGDGNLLSTLLEKKVIYKSKHLLKRRGLLAIEIGNKQYKKTAIITDCGFFVVRDYSSLNLQISHLTYL